MLRKLLKYEIMATGRIFLPLYGVLLIFALINRVLLSPEKFMFPQAISMFLYILSLVGMFVITLVVTIQRFYKNLLSDEGYLMFTLPAQSWKHIASKLIASMLWIVVSLKAAVLSVIIIASNRIFTPESMKMISEIVGKFFDAFGGSSGLIFLEVLLIFVIGLASKVLIVYASIALGHLFNRNRILASLGAFLALSTISQFLTLALGSIPRIIDFQVRIYNVNDLLSIMPSIHLAVWFFLIYTGILSAGYFALTNYVLSRRLNLE